MNLSFYAEPHSPLAQIPPLLSCCFILDLTQSIRNIQHVIPPPPNFYQSRQANWGNPYATADSGTTTCPLLPLFLPSLLLDWQPADALSGL